MTLSANREGTIRFNQHPTALAWVVQDNLFDNIAIFGNTWSGSHTVDYNGYANGSPFYLKGSLQTHDVEDDITYTTGAFGDYYQPSSGNDFLNAGSRTASAAALAQYTVLDDTSKDTGNVDIGFHYPAVDGNGDLYDSDSDGYPDYLEDVNGDGTIGSTEYEPDDDLWVDSNATPELLAELIMANTGATVVPGSVTYTGAEVARGTFGNGYATGVSGDGLPIDFGVILSTGPISNAIGPNDDDGLNTLASGCVIPHGDHDLQTEGDTDLEDLLDADEDWTSDAAVLEFNISVPSTMTLSVEYIYGSEEYTEFINMEKTDPMAIFITEVVSEEYTIDPEDNIAIVSSDPVTVNTINNSSNYRNNPDTSPVLNIQHDGFTIDTNNDPLVASTSSLAAGIYHVKIAIADYGVYATCNDDPDSVFDSAIFIKVKTICE